MTMKTLLRKKRTKTAEHDGKNNVTNKTIGFFYSSSANMSFDPNQSSALTKERAATRAKLHINNYKI